jgi:hypothetical protein
MKRIHSDPVCEAHWRMGPLSSMYPGPCGKQSGCMCTCHTNGIESLIYLLVKLGIRSVRNKPLFWSISVDRQEY